MFNNPSLPSLPSNTTHNFSRVPTIDTPRSKFDRSHGSKLTFNADLLVPVYVDEVLPGDTFNMSHTMVGRINTLIYPLMDNIYLDTFYFEVPLRIIQDNFVKIHGERKNPGDSIDFTSPKVNLSSTGGVTENTLYDYLDYPIGDVYNTNPNNYAARAYNLIWNEWFRDQNLQDSVVVDLDDGIDNPNDYVLLPRGKRHDYFTSCLPWPQKGDAVSLPLGNSAPVSVDSTTGGNPWYTRDSSTGNIFNSGDIQSSSSGELQSVSVNMYLDPRDTLVADLSGAASATINELRLAFQTQKVLERDARGGTRFVEMLKSHFGVQAPDFRLQRPHYLGGSTAPVNIQDIPQTSSTDATTPQGNLSAMGTVMNQASWTQSFTEHSIVIGLVSVRADLTYQQGIPRMHSRSTRFDWYYPSLAHIGEQAVLNKEIYSQGTSTDEEVFGYQERWAEYRYKPSTVKGLFRSEASNSLDAWHLSQDFANLPALNADFIESDTPMDRVVAVTDEPDFKLDCWFDLKCARPMPIYSVPGLIDHF